MNRRTALASGLALATAGLAGCTANGLPGVRDDEKLIEEAEEVPYGTLYRNISQYEGEVVRFRDAHISGARNVEKRSSDWILDVEKGFGSQYVWGNWGGDPFQEDDRVTVVGIVQGLKTFETFLGEETAPELDLIQMELSSETDEGDTRDEGTVLTER